MTSVDDLMREIHGSPRLASDLGWWFIPNGWVYQNKAVIATLEEELIASFDFTNQTILPYKAKATALRWDEAFRHATPYNFIAAFCVPNFSRAAESMARNQT